MNKEELDKHRRLLIELCKEKDNEISILQARIDKAIEYIKEHCIDDEFYNNLTNKEKHIIVALNILQGEDNER